MICFIFKYAHRFVQYCYSGSYDNIVTCKGVCVMKKRVLDRTTGFISTSATSSPNHTQYSAITDLLNFQFTVAHALGISDFTSLLLATDLNTETSISNHYEVFFLIRLQSLCTPLS
jgi:hypothetical protein